MSICRCYPWLCIIPASYLPHVGEPLHPRAQRTDRVPAVSASPGGRDLCYSAGADTSSMLSLRSLPRRTGVLSRPPSLNRTVASTLHHRCTRRALAVRFPPRATSHRTPQDCYATPRAPFLLRLPSPKPNPNVPSVCPDCGPSVPPEFPDFCTAASDSTTS